MTQKNQQATISLYGNLGGDPQEHSIPAKSGTAMVYDPIIDDVVERSYDFPERNFLTFSIATGGYADKPLRWHNCVDWEGEAFRFRKGDRVKLVGYFENRTYTDKKTGETKTNRQFVVTHAELKKAKVREELP